MGYLHYEFSTEVLFVYTVSLQFSSFNSIRILGSEPAIMSWFLWLGRKQGGKEETEER